MMDNRKGRIVDGTGHNMFYEGTEGAEAFRSQERLYDYYAKQVAEKQNDKSNVFANKKILHANQKMY